MENLMNDLSTKVLIVYWRCFAVKKQHQESTIFMKELLSLTTEVDFFSTDD